MDRVERLPVTAIFEVQVIARGPARTADPTDDIPLRHALPWCDQVTVVVRVSGFDTLSVIDHDHLAIATFVVGEFYPAVGGSVNRGSARRPQVDAAVQATAAVAEMRRYLEMAQRPDEFGRAQLEILRGMLQLIVIIRFDGCNFMFR